MVWFSKNYHEVTKLLNNIKQLRVLSASIWRLPCKSQQNCHNLKKNGKKITKTEKTYVNNKNKNTDIGFRETYFMVFCISGPLVNALTVYVFVLVAPYVSHILWAKYERVLLNCAPTSTKLHPPPPNSFQPLPSSLQHPKKYSNQSIRNWAISPNLDRKIQRSSF